MDHTGKIVTLDRLCDIAEFFKGQGKTVVHCHGVFDLLHIGHIRYLSQARDMGDVLVVTLTPDQYVDKGPHRPAFNQELRAEALASLKVVDLVAVNQWPTAEETLRRLRPHVYVKGADFTDAASDPTGKLAREEAVVREVGARMAFTKDVVFSSSNLINRYISNFSQEVQDYLTLLRQRHSIAEVLSYLDRALNLTTLIVGDTILDEYNYCEAIGMSSKDPVLAVKHQSKDLFAGGVLAVANHAANFCAGVRLLSVLGQATPREDFVRQNLAPAVDPFFAYQQDAPTIVKSRFVEGYSLNKLFEVYHISPKELDPAAEDSLLRELDRALPTHDVAIVSDFGHNAITPRMVERLCAHTGFVAVNTQANAGNRGFHTISRYRRASFACIAEHELRLETRRHNGDPRTYMAGVGERLGAEIFIVTRGKKGCLIWTPGNEPLWVPSFTSKVVDRVGAGDAFFAVSSLLARVGAPLEVIGFVGNVVGALAVEIVGNKTPIDRGSVEKCITSLLK